MVDVPFEAWELCFGGVFEAWSQLYRAIKISFVGQVNDPFMKCSVPPCFIGGSKDVS